MTEANNVNNLQQDIARIKGLIDETTTLMSSPVSHLASDMSDYLEQNASQLAAPLYSKFKTLTSSGKKETIIVGALVLGGLFLGAKAIDGVRNLAAYTKAKNQLAAYHQALAVKNNMLIEAQQELIVKLTQKQDLLEDDREELIQTLGILSSTIDAIKAATAKK